MEQSFLCCPTCGQMDAVQKVSSVVESGTMHGTGTSYGVAAVPLCGGLIVSNARTYTRSQTELSSKLAFPKRSYGCASALGGVSFFLAPISFCTIASFESSATMGTTPGMGNFAVTVFCIFIAICVGSLVYIIMMKIKHAQ